MRVALVVIARDEAPRIGRLLRSAAPWVDEMFVLDTGSVDATVEAATACGATVRHFDWCDDFSAARNAALEQAAADWHLVLDADEWLVEGGPALRALKSQAADFVGVVRRDDEEAAAGVVHNWLSRVLPGKVRYTGRVHEQPVHDRPLRRLPVVVGHDGYAADRMAVKRGRNRPLLLAEIAASPGDAFYWYELGIDHAAYGEHESAAQAFARADTLRAPDAAWRADLSARYLYTLKKSSRHAEALAHAERRLADCQDSPDFFFALGDLLLDWAAEQPSDAGQLLPMAQAAWQRCLEIGERPDQPGSVAGRGSFLAAHNLAVVCDGLGRGQEAAALRTRYPRSD
jgi:glycosyltransferase involved in cell wall biosynthesis